MAGTFWLKPFNREASKLMSERAVSLRPLLAARAERFKWRVDTRLYLALWK